MSTPTIGDLSVHSPPVRRVGFEGDGQTVVRLLDAPVDLFFEYQDRVDGLLREFALIALGSRTGVTERAVPEGLRALVDEVETRFGGWSGDIRAAFEAAAAAGEPTVDLELYLAPIAADISERLRELLIEADEFCRSGQLLTLAASPELVAWREWWFGPVIGQVREGHEHTPWPGAAP